jgi:hypothetical protein
LLCRNVYSGTASAVERAHAAELSVGCGGENLRRELDGLTVRTTLADQTIKTIYSASHSGFLSVEYIGYFCVPKW